MKAKNKALAEKGMQTRLWEDTVIIALRDLQWTKALEREQPRPGALLKLDGHTETALGDAITNVGARFFLFEFKSDARAAGSEHKKPLVTIMKAVANLPATSEDRKRFEDDSRAAHHFVFPVPVPAPARPRPEPDEPPRASVVTDCYYDAAIAMTGSGYTLRAGVDIVSMLYPAGRPTSKYGLSLADMAAYLEYLARRYAEWRQLQPKKKSGKAEGKPPEMRMKALVWSDDGFFWPVADMTNLEDVVRVLNGHHNATHMHSLFVLSGYPNELSLFDPPPAGP